MHFDTYVAIDWSGAKATRGPIQVAECSPNTNMVRLVDPPGGGHWTRTKILGWFYQLFREHTALVGLDFAFAYPFCDVEAYFPGHPDTPQDVQELWNATEKICASVSDFYGGPFYRDPKAQFADYFFCEKPKRRNYQERFRVTEMASKAKGAHPASVFKCIGPQQVGPGSVAGFRLLNQLTQDPNVSVWPFWQAYNPQQSVVVEIFPRLFLQMAGVKRSGQPDRITIEQTVGHYGISLLGHNAERHFTKDERDALVSAAALRHLSQDRRLWEPTKMTKCCAVYEGWIFGVP